MAKVMGYVFVEAEAPHVADVVDAIVDIQGVKSAYAVTGRYDVIVQVEAADFTELATIVLAKLRKVKGVKATETALVIREPRKEL